MANRFVSNNELKKIDLEDGDWIKIPTELSYSELEEASLQEGSSGQKAAQMLSVVLKEWNFKDEKGEVVPINLDTIKQLKISTIIEIAKFVTPLMDIQKKGFPNSDKQLGAKEETKDMSTS